MSIIRMQRIAVIGLDTRREELMSRLMEFGAVELTDQTGKLEDSLWKEAAVKDENQEAVSALEAKVNRADQALEILERYASGKKPLFRTRRKVSRDRVEQALRHQDLAEDHVDDVMKLYEKLQNTAELINRTETDMASLMPWASYDLPLEVEETRCCRIRPGVMPSSSNPEETGRELEEKFESIVFRTVSSDRDLHYVVLLAAADVAEDAVGLLKQRGFSEISFRGFTGTAAECLDRLTEENAVRKAEYLAVEKEITALADQDGFRECLEEYSDLQALEADRQRIRSRLLKTRRTFFLEGWIPASRVDEAKEILNENECYYMFRNPEEGENVPVALANGELFVPFESITEMYSLPDYRGFDPTGIFALFYAVFFGIMLSDAGYGLLMVAACFIVLKKYDLEGSTFKMIKLFLWCGVSTVFWGALFGGWFGDFIQVFGKIVLHRDIVIQPIWFNPIDDPMKLLIFSLALGIVHIFIGMGIKAYMQIRDGRWFDAICDEGFWYLLIIGLIAWLGCGMFMPGLAAAAEAGKWMSIIGAAGLLLTGGRYNKGIGKITGGLGALYNITSYLSDILSYSRLLALGLATGVIAQVVNTMGSLFGDGILGAIVLMALFLVGHTLNFAINALGSYVHSCRLQYIEFFGKFYEDGGESFDPFRAKTRYIKVEEKK